MSYLPIELWQLVCKNLSSDTEKEALKNFRLACKYFDGVAVEQLFRVIHVSVRRSSLDHLKSLSSCNELSRYVRHLRCWADIVDVPLTRLSPSPGIEKNEQLYLFYSDTLEIVLFDAVKAFSRLNELSIDRQDDGNRRYHYLANPICDVFEAFGMAMACAALTSSHRSTKLSRVNYNCINCRFFAKDIWTPLKPHSLSSLTNLSLCTRFDELCNGDCQVDLSHMLSFLQCAPNLVSLTLRLGENPLQEMSRLKDVLEDCTWPQLEFLSLDGFEIDPEYALHLFERHQKTLRSIAFGDLRDRDRFDGNLDFFSRIASILSLDSVTFCHSK